MKVAAEDLVGVHSHPSSRSDPGSQAKLGTLEEWLELLPVGPLGLFRTLSASISTDDWFVLNVEQVDQ